MLYNNSIENKEVIKMKKHIFMVGLKDKDQKKQVLTKSTYLKTIFEVCGDCTISDAVGYYTHTDGTSIKEPSLRVEMLFKNDNEIQPMADRLKVRLNQESIGYDFYETNPQLL